MRGEEVSSKPGAEDERAAPTEGPTQGPGRSATFGGLPVLGAVLVAALFGQPFVAGWFSGKPAIETFATVFVSICVQALPFLVLGVVLSACLTAFVPASFFARALPGRPAWAVPVAASCGVLLPGCECASVPIAGSLVRSGLIPPAAFAFLLSAPAVNPIVLASTAVAFPNQPLMVVARLVASLLAACVVGWVWLRFGRRDLIRLPQLDVHERMSRRAVFREAAQHDLMHAGGFLVVGGLTAAVLNVLVPSWWLDAVAGLPVISVLALAGLAVAMAICSEADAFVAASLSQFSLTSRLVFLAVGPMIDVKLFALQAGTFGRSFASRFAPLTFVVAVASGLLVGWWLL